MAVKTGTTNDFKDFWTLGYDAGNVSLGVWVGNNDNVSAESFKAGSVSHNLWKRSMEIALEEYSETQFTEPEPLADVSSKPVF